MKQKYKRDNVEVSPNSVAAIVQGSGIRCEYCGSTLPSHLSRCESCGSKTGSSVFASPEPTRILSFRNLLLGFLIWLLAGLFGGYAYWSGRKTAAYMRISLWVLFVSSASLGAAMKEAGNAAMSSFFVLLFGASIVLIFVFWFFDLVRLLMREL